MPHKVSEAVSVKDVATCYLHARLGSKVTREAYAAKVISAWLDFVRVVFHALGLHTREAFVLVV